MFLTTSGLRSRRWCRARGRSPTGGVREHRIVRPWPVFCSCCGRAFSGTNSRPNLAVVARLAGGASGGVARGRGLGGPALAAAGASARCRRLGLASRGPGQREPARQKGGAAVRPGTKRHFVTDARGTPLGVTLSGANRNDSRMLASPLDAVPGVGGRHRGRPRRRPAKVHADMGYNHRRCRRECLARGIQPRIAQRGVESRTRLVRHRWG